jgi:hypothetical protein
LTGKEDIMEEEDVMEDEEEEALEDEEDEYGYGGLSSGDDSDSSIASDVSSAEDIDLDESEDDENGNYAEF